jgi:hypothetical protein
MNRFRLGVVGFSRPSFDQSAAAALLATAIPDMLARHGATAATAELVSGLTDQGVPALAYRAAAALGLRTVGLSARQALRVAAGRYPVDELVISGTRFGDESPLFIARIDALIRIGGGPQSRHEVELFRAALADRGHDPATHLVEHEVAWLGAVAPPRGGVTRRPPRRPAPHR